MWLGDSSSPDIYSAIGDVNCKCASNVHVYLVCSNLTSWIVSRSVPVALVYRDVGQVTTPRAQTKDPREVVIWVLS